MSHPTAQSPASGKGKVVQIEITDEKIEGDFVVWTIEMDDEAVLAFAKIGLARSLEDMVADGETLERQENEPRQEEPAASHKDSPEFFDLQAHFQKEK